MSVRKASARAIYYGAPIARRLDRAAIVLVATVGLFFVLGSAQATPQGKIVVHGAASGAHLELSVRGNSVVVHGVMARAQPTGCHFTRHRREAVCPLRGISSIEVDMGPSGDFVEVLDKLPIPLTVYLGDGSDKFIGNGERDTCYSQGAKRNRCIGRGGDDICITGQRNSDCVGGQGNDYCRHGAGSDGCWGGAGRDICVMGPGQDGCHGDGGRDYLHGGPSPDRLYGGGGDDHCDGGPGWGKSQGCERGPRR